MTIASEDGKLDRLREIVRGYGSALVAFSGGADSALVLKVAADELGARRRARSPRCRRRWRAARRRARSAFAAELGVAIDVVDSHELERPGFKRTRPIAATTARPSCSTWRGRTPTSSGLQAVLLGTNLDDLGDHRPGLAAANERGARHPLVEAGLTKAEVRALSQALGLSTWDKPQLACLSSRFPYGTEITPERLERIDRFEEGLLRPRLPPAARALPRHGRAARARGRRAAARASSKRARDRRARQGVRASPTSRSTSKVSARAR